MHEFSIASGIVETVLAFAESRGIRRIVEVRMTVGELTCVEVDQLKFCFGAITKDSALEDATLEVDIADAAVRCPLCGYEGPPKRWEGVRAAASVPTLECPECGRAAEAMAGHECAIKSLKYAQNSDQTGTALSTA